MVEKDRVWIKGPTNRALYNRRCSARAHQDPSITDWIAYPQDLQNLPTELLWKLCDCMATLPTEQEVQNGFGFKSALPR